MSPFPTSSSPPNSEAQPLGTLDLRSQGFDSMEDMEGGGIPEDMRCKRSDGKQWRCNALSMPDKTVCEKHYYQAKKRAANSALRASLRKGKRKYPYDGADDDLEASSMSPLNGGKGLDLYSPETGMARGSLMQRDPHALQAEENRVKSGLTTPSSSKEMKNPSGIGTEEYYGRSSDSSEEEGLTCHQCRRSDRANVVWCLSCDQKGYCDSCIARWYADISMEDIQKMCPACCGICNCRVCFNADILIKAKVQEIDPIDKLQYLHSLLSSVLPVLKQIYVEQCFEIGVETRVHGIKAEIPRAKINVDEQMCCDLCKIPIFDYHRHCTNCLYDLCLTCCRELRRASNVLMNGDPGECQVSERNKDVAAPTMIQESYQKRAHDISILHSTNQSAIGFSLLFTKWKANKDGSIPCGPEDAGGCGSSRLSLRRIFKINWAAKLVKNAEEIICGCEVSDMDTSDRCSFCMGSSTSHVRGSSELSLCKCSQRDDSNDNFLYCPAMQDLKHEGISHFHKHWVKGEPIIVKNVFEHFLAPTWDPATILRGIQETTGRMIDDNVYVKAVDCSNQLEVDINFDQFIKGYYEGGMQGNSRSGVLKLKDWPPPSSLEEFISCQRPEFLSNFPLVEFIHFKWGVLNLAAKLPHDTLQTEVGPKMLVAYGTHKENDRGDSVTNLQINMDDLVYLLMHTADVNNEGRQKFRTERDENTFNVFDSKGSLGLNFNEDNFRRDQVCNGPVMDTVEKKGLDSSYSWKDAMDVPEKGHAGAMWDVFRRQDVPKLNEYMRVHCKELTDSARRPVNSVMHPVYNQACFLNKDHKRKLKEELRIEPWTFEQHIGEAVFIPAGCPFQVRNFQPSVQLVFDFLSPESLGESARMAHEIRSLPNDHEVKLKMLEVGKMSLYAASSAIREIHKITLDPKLSSDIRYQDWNLTKTVSENIERITKRKQIACT